MMQPEYFPHDIDARALPLGVLLDRLEEVAVWLDEAAPVDHVTPWLVRRDLVRQAMAALTRHQDELPEVRLTPRLHAALERTATGMLTAFINDHGFSLEGAGLGSAAKRVSHGIFGLLKTHPDIRQSDAAWRDERCQDECSKKAARIAELEQINNQLVVDQSKWVDEFHAQLQQTAQARDEALQERDRLERESDEYRQAMIDLLRVHGETAEHTDTGDQPESSNLRRRDLSQPPT